jgi:hypothetical protein
LAGKTAAIGYLEAADMFPSLPAIFSSQPVTDNTSLLFSYVLQGDSDLDGDADLDDVGGWSTNSTGELGGAAGSTRVWSQGDWDYDGDVDLDDVGKWSVNFTGELGGNVVAPATAKLAQRRRR